MTEDSGTASLTGEWATLELKDPADSLAPCLFTITTEVLDFCALSLTLRAVPYPLPSCSWFCGLEAGFFYTRLVFNSLCSEDGPELLSLLSLPP